MSVAIKVENLSKAYQIGQIGTGTISRDLERWWITSVRGKEDPFLKIGETNDRSVKGDSDIVWSLRDINCEINQGDAVGIIGRNGAGKSTLLKILSEVTSPTTGKINIKGRIASLLEVGTGFHPELTGKENIFLNGAILGMRKKEIQRKLDEIIAFSGVERYVDTPVKRYSSGMYVRLAFAVAAHLESEILIVDEVLAVGDAEFQKKCLGKMNDVKNAEGRTVLFVSHNMAAIKDLCNKSILLKNGQLERTGNTNEIVRHYLANPATITSENDLLSDSKSRRGNGEIRFTEILINNGDLFIDPEKEIKISFKCRVNETIDSAYFSLMIRGPENSEPITNTGLLCLSENRLYAGSFIKFDLSIPSNTFRTGLFPLYFWLGQKAEIAGDNYPFDVVDSVYYFNISSDKPREVLGYNSLQPVGYFNFDKKISEVQIKQNADR